MGISGIFARADDSIQSPSQKSRVVALDDACQHTAPPHQISKYDTQAALGSAWFPVSLFQVLRYEIYSLLGRIREARKTELYQWGIAVLPEWLGALIGREYLIAQRSCNEDTQKITQIHPWMSLTDNLIFLQGWTLGAAWSYRTRHSEGSLPVQPASGYLADSEDCVKSMHEPAPRAISDSPNLPPPVHT
jgi:hypothetical protein